MAAARLACRDTAVESAGAAESEAAAAPHQHADQFAADRASAAGAGVPRRRGRRHHLQRDRVVVVRERLRRADSGAVVRGRHNGLITL